MDPPIGSSLYSVHSSVLYKTRGSHERIPHSSSAKTFCTQGLTLLLTCFTLESMDSLRIHWAPSLCEALCLIWGTLNWVMKSPCPYEAQRLFAMEVLTVGYLLSLSLSSCCWNWSLKNIVIFILFYCVSPVTVCIDWLPPPAPGNSSIWQRVAYLCIVPEHMGT